MQNKSLANKPINYEYRIYIHFLFGKENKSQSKLITLLQLYNILFPRMYTNQNSFFLSLGKIHSHRKASTIF